MSDRNDTKDHALSRIYREGSWPEPNRQIDQAILAASRRAARERHSLARRWAPSFAIAATLVLTSSLVLKVYREQPGAVSPAAPDKAQPARTKQPAAEPNAPETKPAPAPTPQFAATPKGFSTTMDAAEAERLERTQRDLGLKQVLPASESPLPAAKPAPAEKAAPALKKETPEAGRATDSLQRRADPLPAPRTRESQTAREPQTVSAPISVFGAPPPAATPQSPRAVAKPAVPFTQNAPASPEPVQPQAAEAARIQPPVPAAQPAPSPTVSGALIAGTASKAAERSPQRWVEDIRKLMTEGKSEEAGRELADFKKRYPDYVLPDDLR